MKTFPIIVEKDENGNYIVSCPLFKGCHSYGKTLNEALENIKEAIELCLEEDEGAKMNKSSFIGILEVGVDT